MTPDRTCVSDTCPQGPDKNACPVWQERASGGGGVGFLPEERAWIEGQLGSRTLVDVVRRLHPDGPGPWSWWSWLGGTYARDEGWRIDYHLVTPALARGAVATRVDRESTAGVRISDHGAVVVDYDLP